MRYKIYPPIGIARVGNSASSFFVGPEKPGHPSVEIDNAGVESAVQQYKVNEHEIKRQAARFRVFEFPDDGSDPRPASLPPGAAIEWRVHLVNKKAAVVRDFTPPAEPGRPQLSPNSAARLIDPGERVITGANSSGVIFDTGKFEGRSVPLGELRTDRSQNLIVLGGFGFSSSPTNTTLSDFYKNDGWHDDVSDGPVSARIRLPGGGTIETIEPAWVVAAPPDFAPAIQGVVTLYDILLQVGIDHFSLEAPPRVFFTEHIFPLLRRTRGLQWVNRNPNWSRVADDWQTLSDPSTAAAPLRQRNARAVRDTQFALSDYRLTELQKSLLDRWVAGDFVSDWTGVPQPPEAVSARGLTRAALESTVGQGFFPGIEGGIILTDPALYFTPFDFRLDHARVQPGDITALMAQPWQADFFDCSRSWWPSQRPDDVLPNADATAAVSWAREVDGEQGMVDNFSKLAFVTAQKDSHGNIVFAEDQRAT